MYHFTLVHAATYKILKSKACLEAPCIYDWTTWAHVLGKSYFKGMAGVMKLFFETHENW